MKTSIALILCSILLTQPAFAATPKFKNCIDAKGQIVVKRKCNAKKGEQVLTLNGLTSKVVGLQGVQGVQGVQGQTGEKGEKGEKGDKGDIGPEFIAPEVVTFQSAWEAGTTYAKHDLVISETPGLYFFSEVDGNLGQKPESNPGAWTGAELSQLKLIRRVAGVHSNVHFPLFILDGATGSKFVGAARLDYTLKASSPTAAVAETNHAKFLIVGFVGGGSISIATASTSDKVSLGTFSTNFSLAMVNDQPSWSMFIAPTLPNLNSIEIVFRVTNLSIEPGVKLLLAPET